MSGEMNDAPVLASCCRPLSRPTITALASCEATSHGQDVHLLVTDNPTYFSDLIQTK